MSLSLGWDNPLNMAVSLARGVMDRYLATYNLAVFQLPTVLILPLSQASLQITLSLGLQRSRLTKCDKPPATSYGLQCFVGGDVGQV